MAFEIGDRLVEIDTGKRGRVCEVLTPHASPEWRRVRIRYDGSSSESQLLECARFKEDVANDEVAAVEKAREKRRVPRVGEQVVRTAVGWSSNCLNKIGESGVVELVDADGYFYALGSRWRPEWFGTKVIPVAEWDAQQQTAQRAQLLDGFQNSAVMRACAEATVVAGKAGQLLTPQSFITASLGPATITITDDTARLVLPDSFTAKLAIAMFESDHAGTVARVADDGKGGIGTDEARQRLVWRSGEDQRAQYMREAAALLKRAGQL
jgi:hypothetical protein